MIMSGWYAHTVEENITILLLPCHETQKATMQEAPIKSGLLSTN